ncbi:MAG: tetratricopeptide repeat protein [Dehalococcoidia bacterium]
MTKTPAHNLPVQPTPFLGRTGELRELEVLLGDANCRLLTLVGPGGAGKTRLSIEAARAAAAAFADGVHFVALQPVTSPELVVPAIADALKFSLRQAEEPKVQLFGHLAEKRLLLLLDNFEHLLAAADLLSDLLSAAPGAKIMVSSREALNLAEEWVVPVPGMRFPEEAGTERLEEYDAVRLFVERARRVKRDYSPEGDWGEIARVCQLVRGMPLGVELAAAWVKVLPARDIVAEIERSLDFLATSTRNVPERHRSMRAVFDESWRLLSDDERDVFKRLSVMRGPFGREAAASVAGATLTLLSELVDKSLLRPLPDGRYEVHELLRQYAYEKLEESPDDVAAARDRHCEHYAGFLESLTGDVYGRRQLEASAAVEAEMENVRAAWQWAVDQAKAVELGKAVRALTQCWQFKARYAEAAAALQRAADSLSRLELTLDSGLALAQVLVNSSWFALRLGRVVEAEAAARRSREVYQELKAATVPGFATEPLCALGIIATVTGDYDLAAELGEEARSVAEARGDPANLQLAYYVLARAAFLQGRHQEAKEYAERAYAITSESGERWFRAYCLIERGNVARALGDYAAASADFQASFAIREEFDDPEGMAVALSSLGEVLLPQGKHKEARERFQRALAIYLEIHDKGGLSAAHSGLARAALALDDHASAREQFREGLKVAAAIGHVPQILSLVTGTGELLLKAGDREAGLELLGLAMCYPATDHETKMWVERVLGAVDCPDADPAKAIAVLRATLSLPDDLGLSKLLAGAEAKAEEPEAAPAYPDGLTEREVDVLRLISQGKSNRAISGELFITENTVANHVKSILSKTQSGNRTEAAAYAIEKGLSQARPA